MTQLKVLNKTLIFALLLILSSSQIARAQPKVYQYDGKMPFVKMMLTMMEAMGILDKVPARGVYGPYGQYGRYGNNLSPWSGRNNNPFSGSPWSQSPWTQSTNDGVSPVWGSPDWGVLPSHKYSYYSYGPYGTRWSSTDLDGWVDEPWESSKWNPQAETKIQTQPPVQLRSSQRAQPQLRPAQPVVPIVQNFNYNLPESAQRPDGPGKNARGDSRQSSRQNNNQRKSNPLSRTSPLAKLQQPSRRHSPPVGPPGSQGDGQYSQQQSDTARLQKPRRHEKPCITEFCGLKKPNLNGLWVAQDGEMLGIKNNRYLWNDGDSRYLTGQLKIQNEYLLASVDGHEKLMRFKYKLSGNHLLTMQPDGKIREFVRTPNNQYDGQYPGYGYGQNYGQSNEQDYRQYPGQNPGRYSGQYPGQYPEKFYR